MDEFILFVAVVVTLAVVYFLVQSIKNHFAKKRAQKERHEEALRRLEKMRQDDWAKVRRVNSEPIRAAIKNTQAVPPRSSPAPAPSPSYAPSPTQSVQSSRSILDDVADVAMIANTIRHWNDNERSTPEPVREERSAGVTKSESSWGFDDSDSRKSVSDTFSSSSSSDSWSSSSSSDSGPSSDW